MTLSHATEKDIQAVLALYESVKGEPFSVWNESYPTLREIRGDVAADTLFLLKEGETLLATLSVNPENELADIDGFLSPAESAREICRIAVAPAFRGRGLAKEIVTRVLAVLSENGVKSVRLSAARGNLPAKKTYEKLGFTARREAFLYGGEYILYEKTLP